MSAIIRCQHCGRERPADAFWYRCNTCGYRICMECLSKHQGQYGRGFKCGQCISGYMESKEDK